jgi:Flp pilus assembly pilin Flp
MLTLLLRYWIRLMHRPVRPAGERGQTTAEYALITGAMALVFGLVAAWAASTGKIGQLLDTVFNQLVQVARGG